jgi:hypothetical protein
MTDDKDLYKRNPNLKATASQVDAYLEELEKKKQELQEDDDK